MSSYLDQYGAGEERRERIIKWLVGLTFFSLFFGILGYYLFKNHAQEAEVRHFISQIRAKDYKGGYASWGCTDAKPCRGYPYEKYLEEWGPANNAAEIRITDSETCNAGVIVSLIKSGQEEKLWVEKNHSGLGFSPFPSCPNKSPLANMIHQTVGKLRKPFLN